MTVFFTKTCARDWERQGYQTLAIKRLFPLATHVILIERDELERASALRWPDHELAAALNHRTPATVRVFLVEELMPEAMRIKKPDLRQQYCKLRAPVILGEDTIQLDSDMCPKPGQTRWMDELYGPSGWRTGIRWNAPKASKAMQPAVENWAKTYTRLFSIDPGQSLDRDFMRSQFGWHVPRDVARGFLRALGPDPIETIQQCIDERRKFSEYQLLGMWAADKGDTQICFLDYVEKDPWLMHFTSKDALEPAQRKLLRQAAGLEE